MSKFYKGDSDFIGFIKSKYVLHSYILWKFQQSIGNKSQTHLLQSRVTGSP